MRSDADMLSSGFLNRATDGKTPEIGVRFQYSGEAKPLLHACALPLSQIAERLHLRSTYYDTPDFALWKNNFTVRVRRGITGPFFLCVRSKDHGRGGIFQRIEVEAAVPQCEPELRYLAAPLARQLAIITRNQPLLPVFETRVSRSGWELIAGSSKLELTLDDGEATLPDGRCFKIHELELRLRSGVVSDLYGMAHKVAESLSLRLEAKSNSEKGIALLLQTQPVATKAATTRLKRDHTLDETIELTLSSILSHFIGNLSAVLETGKPECIHQLRVSLRRMRSAFKMFAFAIDTHAFEDLRQEAKRIASILAPTRQLDSFIAQLEGGALKHLCGLPEWNVILATAKESRDAGLRAATPALADHRVTLFILRLQLFLAGREWRSGAPPSSQAVCGKSIRRVAKVMLGHFRARVLKKARRLAKGDDGERHKIRIALKDLRYGMEFFASVFAHRRSRKRMMQSLEKLQEGLGNRNDLLGFNELVAHLSVGRGPEAAQTAGHFSGSNMKHLALDLARLEKERRKLAKCKVFWRN